MEKIAQYFLLSTPPLLLHTSPSFYLFVFFSAAPRKAAAKTDKTETNEGEKKTNPEKKNLGQECKDKMG